MARNYISNYTLDHLFHLMENGSIAIPAFQRAYVWRKEAVKELFVSINNGYPIGILIAVEHEPNHFETASSSLTLFPEVPNDTFIASKRLWILDGSQRLAALYNVLFGRNDSFTLLYDLTENIFLFPQEVESKDTLLTMSFLFNVKELMKLQAKIARLDNSEALLENLYSVHNRFKNYQVPIQVIADVDDKDVINIFMTLNTSGTALGKHELEQAMKYRRSEQ